MKRNSVLVALTCVVCLASCVRDGSPPAKTTVKDVHEMQYQMAEALVVKGEHDQAAPFIRGLLKTHPKSARLHMLLGIVLREKGVLLAAEQELRLAIQLQPKDSEGHNALGILLTQTKRYDEA